MERFSFSSVSLVRQGEHTFYSLTIPSEVLASTCFVINREEDPIAGFQRELDQNRAREIALYIDEGLGTIPSSIVLSAQEDALLEYDRRKKSISFNGIPKAFLIIDGQHRVYGFHLARKSLRIPVVIYNGLNKRDETRLFIDINSKQKGVPAELLLDIKKMAEYENDQEQFMRNVFDLFMTETTSCLIGKLSSAKKSDGQISRVVFNAAMKNIIKIIGNKTEDEIFDIYNSYLTAVMKALLKQIDGLDLVTQPTFFKALSTFFIPVASRLKDKFGAIYSTNNFYEILEPIGPRIKKSKIKELGTANQKVAQYLEENLSTGFIL